MQFITQFVHIKQFQSSSINLDHAIEDGGGGIVWICEPICRELVSSVACCVVLLSVAEEDEDKEGIVALPEDNELCNL